MLRQIITLSACMFWVFGLAQCGSGDSRSKDVTFSTLPQTALAIDAPYVECSDGECTEEDGPYFRRSFSIINNSDSTLHIVNVKTEVTAFTASGQLKAEFDLDLAETCLADDTSRSYLVRIASGDTFVGLDFDATDGRCNDLSGAPQPNDDSALMTDDVPETFVTSGLPAKAISYSATVTPIGYFVDSNGTPIENLYTSAFQNITFSN